MELWYQDTYFQALVAIDALQVIFVAIRMYVRGRMLKVFGWDDVFCFITLVSGSVFQTSAQQQTCSPANIDLRRRIYHSRSASLSIDRAENNAEHSSREQT